MMPRIILALSLFSFVIACHGRPEEQVRERCIPPGQCEGITTEFKEIPGDAARGGSIFQENCATCHGVDARGIPAKSSQDLTDPEWQKKTKDAQIRNVIQIGQGMKMPAFRLGQQQLADLVAFIRASARDR